MANINDFIQKAVSAAAGKVDIPANIKDQVAKGYLPADTALPEPVLLENSTSVIDPSIKFLTDTAQSTRYCSLPE